VVTVGNIKPISMVIDQFLIYDEAPIWSVPFGLTLLDTVMIIPDINVLDIGAGGGFPMLELAERFGESCQIYGLDPSEDAFSMITEKIRLKEIRNASIIRGFAEEIPFEDGFFGLITANNGLNNVQDAERTLKECYRVAKAEAQMVLTMNLPHTMIEFYEVFEKILEEQGMYDIIQKMHEHIQEKRKPVETWKGLILEAGFSIKTINVDGFRYRFANGSAFLKHYFIREAFMKSWKSIIHEDLISTVFEQIENRLNKIAEERGELTMSVPFVCFNCFKIGD
jgi:arsenite methyltransferase